MATVHLLRLAGMLIWCAAGCWCFPDLQLHTSLSVQERDGMPAVVATSPLAQGAEVVKVPISECVTGDAAVQLLLRGTQQSRKKRLEAAYTLWQHIVRKGDKEAGEEEDGTTPLVDVSAVEGDVGVEWLAVAWVVAGHRAAWGTEGEWHRSHIAAYMNDTEARHLLGALAAERATVLEEVGRWEVVLQELGLSYRRDDIVWAAVQVRNRGVHSSEGVLLCPFSPLLRPMHEGCVPATLRALPQGVLALAVPAGMRAGQEVCLHAADEEVSKQRLVVQHGVLPHPDSDAPAGYGVSFFFPDAVADTTGVLAQHNCPSGELLLGPEGTVSPQHFFCFRLAQLPETVRGDYKTLFLDRHAETDAVYSLGTLLSSLLIRHYNVSEHSLPSFSLAFDPTRADAEPQHTSDSSEVLTGGITIAESMPEKLKAMLRREAESAKQGPAEAREVEAEGGGNGEDSEEEEELLLPEGTERVKKLNEALSRAVTHLRAFHQKLFRDLAEARMRSQERHRQHAAAESERLREQARRAREDLELSQD